MLKETWDFLDVFFKDWNKKLASLLNDERYFWRDTQYMFKPAKKENEMKPENNCPQFSNKTESRNTIDGKKHKFSKEKHFEAIPKTSSK